MSMYYSPELVKLMIMAERLREAKEARLAGELRNSRRAVPWSSRFAGSISRVAGRFVGRSNATPSACTC